MLPTIRIDSVRSLVSKRNLQRHEALKKLTEAQKAEIYPTLVEKVQTSEKRVPLCCLLLNSAARALQDPKGASDAALTDKVNR